MSQYNIMLVDDEKRLTQCIEFVLSLEGYDVTTATNGLDAYQQIKELYENGKSVDLLIIDMLMPQMSGMELLSELNKLKINPVTIGISGYCDNQTIDELNELGCAELMKKPFTPEELILKISEVMHKQL